MTSYYVLFRKRLYNFFIKFWQLCFAKTLFIKLNKLIFQLSLRGLGVLNYTSYHLSGEKQWLKSYFSKIAKKRPIVIDIGANVGDYTKLVLSFRPDAEIHAFEPHPVTYKKLIASSDIKSVSASNLAIGKSKDILTLYDYSEKDASSHASLYKDVIEQVHKSKSVSHSVEVVTLDDYCKENKIEEIDLLKIDTEGNELNCLLGAKSLLKNNSIKAIQFEFTQINIISKTTFKDFFDLLSNNYYIYRLLPGGSMLSFSQYDPLMCEIYAYQNIVAILK